MAVPDAPHGIYVINPPPTSHAAYYLDSVQYLRNASAICGAEFQVHWSALDLGPTHIPEYNFSSVDAEIAPWANVGKQVNLAFLAVGYQPNETFVPSFVLSQVPTLQCGNSSVTPLFWEPSYVLAYQAFIRAAITHFGTNPAVGYLRFGFGTGDETFPVAGQTSSGCLARLNASGFTLDGWTAYLYSMLDFEASLHSPHPLFVALNRIATGFGSQLPLAVAIHAVHDGIGFGVESIQAGNIVPNETGALGCNAAWCSPFAAYAGVVPTYMQTYTATSPNGSGPTGSLVPLLNFSLGQRVQVLELVLQDCLTALDPNYPAYAAYHAAYGRALNATAAVVGSA
ncbi:MAG: hypothetical protein L3K11_04930 [Thermoplasmata archaeon]|nr:hypothetical protein [Thermoplasmata archaeon]